MIHFDAMADVLMTTRGILKKIMITDSDMVILFLDNAQEVILAVWDAENDFNKKYAGAKQQNNPIQFDRTEVLNRFDWTEEQHDACLAYLKKNLTLSF